MRVTLLGTGNPQPSLKRVGSSYMVKVADDVILLDHGSGAHTRLLEAGVQATDITHMMFSHLHYDHCVDFPRLVLSRWDHGAGLIPELKVYGPAGTANHVEKLFGPEGVYEPDITARCEWPPSVYVYTQRGGKEPRLPPRPDVTEYGKGDVIETDSWRVSICEVPHVQPYLTCLAIRIDSDEGSLVYSGDTGPSKALERLAEDCDVLIHMCASFSGSKENSDGLIQAAGHMEAAKTAAIANAKTLVCSHIYGQFDLPGIRERVVSDISKVYSGNIVMGEDLLELKMKPEQLAKFD
jgi:ribonuclease Z